MFILFTNDEIMPYKLSCISVSVEVYPILCTNGPVCSVACDVISPSSKDRDDLSFLIPEFISLTIYKLSQVIACSGAHKKREIQVVMEHFLPHPCGSGECGSPCRVKVQLNGHLVPWTVLPGVKTTC